MVAKTLELVVLTEDGLPALMEKPNALLLPWTKNRDWLSSTEQELVHSRRVHLKFIVDDECAPGFAREWVEFIGQAQGFFRLHFDLNASTDIHKFAKFGIKTWIRTQRQSVGFEPPKI